MSKEPRRKAVHVREMPLELWERLARYAQRTDKKKYGVVIEALRQFLEREEQE